MRDVRSYECFNPCFDGSVARGKTMPADPVGYLGVSILVLMEV